MVSLIHPESHFKEKKAGNLRASAYHRLRRHWQFINKLMLFEISDHVVYGVHVYGRYQQDIQFDMASSLYHPNMVSGSYLHDGSGEEPYLKLNGYWDLRPHKNRIITVTQDVLTTWRDLLNTEDTPADQASMIYTVNKTSERVLQKLSLAPRVRELGLQYSRGWDESIDRKKGYFQPGSKVNESWADVILQGPFFSVANPFAKQPNATMRSNEDYTPIDLEALPADFIPRTSYQPVGSTADNGDYDKSYTQWTDPVTGEKASARRYFRLAWRQMAAITGVRTLYPAIIPPGAAQISFSAGFTNFQQLAVTSALWSSLAVDFLVKSTGVANLHFSFIENLPSGMIFNPAIKNHLSIRVARLTSLTSAYSPFWKAVTGEEWSMDSPARNAVERNRILCEIDALCALGLNISIEELLIIYKSQFSVLKQYDEKDLFDSNGRKLPKEITKRVSEAEKAGRLLSPDELTWPHPQSDVEYTFEPPFAPFDREAELKAAYERFSYLLHQE
ncbi:hypothetical protein ACFP6B_02585 [Rothia nasimurium]|uniref:hypothetical protein n=1 Tax=Rothia nasimurium TaxID=85336 RepID=UPI0036081A3C